MQPSIPRGLATNAGLTATVTAALGAVVNLLAGGPLEATVTPLAGAFATLLTVLIGRYAQAAKALAVDPAVPLYATTATTTASLSFDASAHADESAEPGGSDALLAEAGIPPEDLTGDDAV